MDFNDFLTEYNEKYGISKDDWGSIGKNVIISFSEEDTGRVVARYKGVPVFRHRDSEKTISAGDTWICSLDMSRDTYYFAKGLQKIDASFMYELKRDQIEEIANAVWKEQKHVIEPLLEDKYKKIMEEQLAQAVDDTRGKYEEQIGAMRDSIRQLEQRDAENKQIISSLQEQREAAKRMECTINETVPGSDLANDFFAVKDIQVRREGPDKISSQFFNRSRYFVHLSADHRLLTIKPHENGNVICINSTIVLAGLNLISPFEVSCDMISEYSPQYGGLKIYL
ncbi:MAG: hypothetical protein LBJ20_05105 [Candidatus Methanoplasma sp.]|jgi:hypothetical protein|nr:hypothetical protein [Candidatus Methanoplasma sp.]